MSYSPTVAVLLTALFGVTGIAGIYRSVLALDGIDRASNIVHLVMSFAMLSMPWSWGLTIFPAGWQIAVFSVATAFYVAVLVIRPQAVAGSTAGHHSRPSLLAYHAAMMSSMVLMGIVMLDTDGMSGMAGTTRLKGTNEMARPAASGGSMSMHLSTWENIASVILGVGFVAAALWFLVDFACGLRMSDGRRTFDAGVSALMAVGMSVAFFAL